MDLLRLLWTPFALVGRYLSALWSGTAAGRTGPGAAREVELTVPGETLADRLSARLDPRVEALTGVVLVAAVGAALAGAALLA